MIRKDIIMKKLMILLMTVALISVMLIMSACNKGDTDETGETSQTAYAATQDTKGAEATPDESEPSSSQESNEVPAEKTESETDMKDGEEEYIAVLTQSNYILDSARTSEGEDYPYGSVANETGTFIKFNDDMTFECTLGSNYFKGTYSISDGDIIIDVTESYDAKGEHEFEYDNTITWEHDYNLLAFEYDGIINMFSDHSA